jgi:hypothetical protein
MYVARVNVNEVKVVFSGVHVLFVHTDNKTGCQTLKLIIHDFETQLACKELSCLKIIKKKVPLHPSEYQKQKQS